MSSSEDEKRDENCAPASNDPQQTVYHLFEDQPQVQHAAAEEEEDRHEFDWLDVLAFIIAAYQIIFPLLGIAFAVFLGLWGILWLLSML